MLEAIISTFGGFVIGLIAGAAIHFAQKALSLEKGNDANG